MQLAALGTLTLTAPSCDRRYWSAGCRLVASPRRSLAETKHVGLASPDEGERAGRQGTEQGGGATAYSPKGRDGCHRKEGVRASDPICLVQPGVTPHWTGCNRLWMSKRGQLRAIEDKIGPVWQPSGMSLGTTKRPLLLAGAAVGGLLLLYLLWTLFVASFLGSGYRAEHRPLIENGQPFLEVRVTGKAAKLAVMLTDPQGKTETQVIEENEMITNAKTVRLAMQQKPEAGTYTLLVKSFQPERVVYKATPKFTRGKLTILDASFTGWKPGGWGASNDWLAPTGVTFVVENKGSLPVCFGRMCIVMGDQTCDSWCVVERISEGKEIVVGANPYFTRDRNVVQSEMGRGGLVSIGGAFRPGVYQATVKLYIAGEQEEVLTFQKQVSIQLTK